MLFLSSFAEEGFSAGASADLPQGPCHPGQEQIPDRLQECPEVSSWQAEDGPHTSGELTTLLSIMLDISPCLLWPTLNIHIGQWKNVLPFSPAILCDIVVLPFASLKLYVCFNKLRHFSSRGHCRLRFRWGKIRTVNVFLLLLFFFFKRCYQ